MLLYHYPCLDFRVLGPTQLAWQVLVAPTVKQRPKRESTHVPLCLHVEHFLSIFLQAFNRKPQLESHEFNKYFAKIIFFKGKNHLWYGSRHFDFDFPLRLCSE
jgi:hypothetical protein